MLRDFLNEFQLDWATAPLRSSLIPGEKLNGKRILILGGGGLSAPGSSVVFFRLE